MFYFPCQCHGGAKKVPCFIEAGRNPRTFPTASPFYISTGRCRFDLAFFFSALFLFVLFLFLASIIRTLLERNCRIIPCGMGAANLPLGRKKAVFLLSLVVFFCWLPQLILLYPGTLFFDTFAELSNFASKIVIADTTHPNWYQSPR